MGTPAFNDAADKIRREEAAADKAREAADAERVRTEMSARRGHLDAKYAEQDPKGARMDAFRPTVGDPSGKTPAQADELAILRASPEYARAHRNYLERARNGEDLYGVSHGDGSITSGEGTLWSPRMTVEEARNVQTPGPLNNMRPTSERLKGMSVSEHAAGGFGNVTKNRAVMEVDNLARLEAIEAYQQERARAKRQSEK